MSAQDHTVFLMYHELKLAERALCDDDPGYVRYVVEESAFRTQMSRVAERAMRGVSVSEWVDAPIAAQARVVITFDDGCETDLIAALPILRQHGFGATCYLTVDFLGRPGFLSHAQACELAGSGIEIGCHSMTHAFLSDLDDAGLRREMVDAKDRLEQLCGVPIRSFSCPGGRHDDRVLPLARAAGYDSVTTSKATRNSSDRPSGLLGRVAVMHDTSLSQFDATLSARDVDSRQARDTLLGLAKSLLGNTLYQRIRGTLLR